MTDPQLKTPNDLREAVAVNLGGDYLAALDGLLTDYTRLKELQESVLKKAEMLRHNFWSISGETGPAGELHAAITGLHIDMEGIANQRDQLREKLAKLKIKLL